MNFNFGADPGLQAKVESAEAQITFGHENLRQFDALGKIVSTAVDAGSSPTTMLRAGLVMAKDSSDLWTPYVKDAGDTTSEARGILFRQTSMLNNITSSAESKNQLILVGGLVKAAAIVNLDAKVREQFAGRFVFDDEFTYGGYRGGYLGCSRRVLTKSTDYTVVAADNGTLFIATGAANFTLPTKAVGLVYEFVQTANSNLVITGSSDIIADGNAAVSTITCSTSSHKIGSRVRVECVYTAAATLKWIAANLGGTTLTLA